MWGEVGEGRGVPKTKRKGVGREDSQKSRLVEIHVQTKADVFE